MPSATRPLSSAILLRSWGVLVAHPFVAAALGAAVVLSFASTLFGIGVFVTPWFVCEIFALQLTILTGRSIVRRASWFRAGVFVLGMVGVVVAATWIASLAIGPDVSTADSAAGPLPWAEAAQRVGLIATVTAVAIGFITPFQYAPLVLIGRGGTMGAAALESAWLVRRGGLVRHWALAFAALLLPLAPALIAAVVVARTFERAATPLGVLAGLPLMTLSIPLGQGLLSVAYVQRSAALAEPRWTRREGKPPAVLVAILVALVLAPMASVGLLALGALREAPLTAGPASDGHLVVDREIDAPRVVHVPDATLRLHVGGRELLVEAGDGALTLLEGPWREDIDRVRVRRRGNRYLIEAHAQRWWHAEVDRAAIRTDDSVGARLARLPAWGIPAIGLTFALSALLLIRALEPLGEIRRLYGAPASDRPPLEELRAQRARAMRLAWGVALTLVPPTALGLAAGWTSLLG